MSDLAHPTPLAIVGMACHLPGADGLEAFWNLLRDGVDAVGEMPADRLDRELYFDPQKGVRGKTYSTRGGLISDRPLDRVACPLSDELLRDADPSHIVLCETAARALRHAGYDPTNLPLRNMGTYVGHSGGSSLSGELAFATHAEAIIERLRQVDDFRALPTTEQDAIIAEVTAGVRARRPQRDADGGPHVDAGDGAALVARAFGLNGPHLVIDAACASSLVALHSAALALERGTIDAAIVGGASYAKADSLVLFSQAQSCSAAKSRPFDADADGLIGSEGYVVLVVKTLARAVADGDPIRAVIRGIGMSADGRGRSLWAPRKEGQLEAVRRAYTEGLDPTTVQYVETHATSTQLGDATEIEALAAYFLEKLPAGRRLPIGSVKSNIGHTLEAAGLAGLLKTILAIDAGQLPPSINVRSLNRTVDWQRVPFDVVQQLQPWPTTLPGTPRRAAVNAFGIGGLNVHVVVEAYLPDASAKLIAAVPKRDDDDAVAIVGRGAVLPGAFSVPAFVDLLASGTDPKSEPDDARWLAAFGHDRTGRRRHAEKTSLGGYVRNYQYDWRRHKIPPKQIASANPLQFMLLDAADQALAEAGAGGRPVDRSGTHVVVGTIFGGDFGHQLFAGLRLPELRREIEQTCRARGRNAAWCDRVVDAFESVILRDHPALLDETGSFTSSTLASRLTKTLDLMGGAQAIDAGYCSGTAALSTACDLLLTGRAQTVLCAAAQRSMSRATYEQLDLAGELAVKSVPGEGVVVFLLKRLSEARRDGDRIFGIVRDVRADRKSVAKEPARVDSLIAQIGHTQAASGLASLLQITLENERRPTSPCSTDIVVRSHCGLVHQVRVDPPTPIGMAAVAPKEQEPVISVPPTDARLIRLGAGSISELAGRLSAVDEDVEYLWATGGAASFATHDRARVVFVAKSTAELKTQLQTAATALAVAATKLDRLERLGIYVGRCGERPFRAVGLFPGQGSHYAGLAESVIASDPAAAAVANEADQLLQSQGLPRFAELVTDGEKSTAADLRRAQLAVLTADVAYYAALRRHGLIPDALSGHSLGEFAALVAAGAWTLPTAVAAVLERQRQVAQIRTRPGAMLAISATAAEIAPLVAAAQAEGDAVYLSHRNAPRQTVVAGETSDVERFAERLAAADFAMQRIDVPYPYHTPLLHGAVAPLRAALELLPLQPPRLPLLSHVSLRYAAEPAELRDNLAAQLTQPVRYVELIERLQRDGCTLFVELGPQTTLTGFHRRILEGTEARTIACDERSRPWNEQVLHVQALWECLGGERITSTATAVATKSATAAVPFTTPIESFDATTARRKRLRESSGTRQVAIAKASASSVPLEEFDGTAVRRARNAGGVRREPLVETPASSPVPTRAVAASPVAANDDATLNEFLVNFVVEQTGQRRQLEYDRRLAGPRRINV